jgi:hypothetical protein
MRKIFQEEKLPTTVSPEAAVLQVLMNLAHKTPIFLSKYSSPKDLAQTFPLSSENFLLLDLERFPVSFLVLKLVKLIVLNVTLKLQMLGLK